MITDMDIEKLKLEVVTSCKLCGGSGWKVEGTERCSCLSEFGTRLTYLQANLPAKYYNLGLQDFDDKQQIGYRTIMDYVRNLDSAIKKGTGLYLVGTSGTGKSFMACAILKAALSKGYSGYFTSLSELMSDIKAGFSDSEVSDSLHPIVKNCDLLVIDKIRRVYKTEFVFSKLSEYLDYRDFNNKATLVTDSDKLETLDKYYDSNIKDYFVERCIQVVLTGSNYKEDLSKVLMRDLKASGGSDDTK